MGDSSTVPDVVSVTVYQYEKPANRREAFCVFLNIFVGGTFPFGQLPVFEVDGKMLTQSLTIFKYVARELGKSLF